MKSFNPNNDDSEDDDFSDDDSKGVKEEEVLEVNEERLMAPVTPPSVPAVQPPSVYKIWAASKESDPRTRLGNGVQDGSCYSQMEAGLEEFQQPEFQSYRPKSCKTESKNASNEIPNKLKKSLDAPLVKDRVLDTKDCSVESLVVANCNYHQRERVVSRNNYTRVTHNNSTSKTHPNDHKNIAPRAVLMKTGLRPLNTARPNSAVVNAVRTNKSHRQQVQEDQRYIDSRCSRHMTGNMFYLSEYEEIDDGYVAFGGLRFLGFELPFA
nr:hypothetical protein [Tanacetum cinerariifolium]